MPSPTTPNIAAAKALIDSGIMTYADKAAMTSITDLRAKLTTTRVLHKPSFLFTASASFLDEHDELLRLVPTVAYELAELEPWNGMSEASIARLILDDVSDTYGKLVFIAISIAVRLSLGDTPERSMLSVERVEEFVSSLYERSFGEAAE